LWTIWAPAERLSFGTDARRIRDGGFATPGYDGGEASAAPPADPGEAGSSMEGTSGAAESGLLRGRTDDAALRWSRADTAGVSIQRGSESMTGGARADRVGAKLSTLVSTKVNRRKPIHGNAKREMPAAKAARPLARETSVGDRVVPLPGAARFRASRVSRDRERGDGHP
jgi:hypothetical protein